jgi:hypothetical protein
LKVDGTGMIDIACTLPLTEVPDRLAKLAGAAEAHRGRHPIPGGVRHRFDPAAEARVREIAELESRCCAFLRFAVSRDDDAVVLDITGPPEALPVMEQFF